MYSIMIAFVLSGCHTSSGNEKLSAIEKLPAFKMLSIDSTQCINTAFIAPGNTSIFFYFSPDCEHCQKETRELLEHEIEFRETNIYMVTNESIQEAKKFCQAFRLDTAKNIFIGMDYDYSFYRAFLPPTIPFIAIYDKKKKLRKVYQGETNINSIITAIQE